MISTGNDIVAIASINKERTVQFGFYSKILSVSDQALYHSQVLANIPFENFVWLLWSVKESVYKYYKRNIPDLVFSPAKIIVSNITLSPVVKKFDSFQPSNTDIRYSYQGEVMYKSFSLHFKSELSTEWITTIVNDTNCFDCTCWDIKKIDKSGYDFQSKAVRELLLNKLETDISGNYKIQKNRDGVPQIIRNGTTTSIPVSFSHDGHFVTYAFKPNIAGSSLVI